MPEYCWQCSAAACQCQWLGLRLIRPSRRDLGIAHSDWHWTLAGLPVPKLQTSCEEQPVAVTKRSRPTCRRRDVRGGSLEGPGGAQARCGGFWASTPADRHRRASRVEGYQLVRVPERLLDASDKFRVPQ